MGEMNLQIVHEKILEIYSIESAEDYEQALKVVHLVNWAH